MSLGSVRKFKCGADMIHCGCEMDQIMISLGSIAYVINSDKTKEKGIKLH